MNQARGAGDLLEQIAREEDADILLLSEQSHNMNHEHWYSDDTDYCAIWLRDRAQTSPTRERELLRLGHMRGDNLYKLLPLPKRQLGGAGYKAGQHREHGLDDNRQRYPCWRVQRQGLGMGDADDQPQGTNGT